MKHDPTRMVVREASDTPRTDAAITGTNISSAVFPVVRADFARELERENAELRGECERLKAREVVLSDRQTFLHIALTEAGFPDHEGEDETYRSFSLSERVEQMAAALRAAREAKEYWMRQRPLRITPSAGCPMDE